MWWTRSTLRRQRVKKNERRTPHVGAELYWGVCGFPCGRPYVGPESHELAEDPEIAPESANNLLAAAPFTQEGSFY